MKRRSDSRLLRLVCEAMEALEDPGAGFVFDDFDLRYRKAEHLREKKSAAWYYRDKTPFETKYAADSGANGNREPAWVSDSGRGVTVLLGAVSYGLDGDEDRTDDPKRRDGRSRTWTSRREAALKRVKRNLPHALKTMKLIFRNTGNRKESVCALAKSLISSRANGNSRGRSTTATSTPSSASSAS